MTQGREQPVRHDGRGAIRHIRDSKNWMALGRYVDWPSSVCRLAREHSRAPQPAMEDELSDPRKPYRESRAVAAPPQIAAPPMSMDCPAPEPQLPPAVESSLAQAALQAASADVGTGGGTDAARDILRRGAELYRAAAAAAETGGERRPDSLMARRTSALRDRLGSSRVFLLYVTRNDHVQTERKLTVRATDMEELVERVREEMDLPDSWRFVLCKAAGSSVGGCPSPVPYNDFAAIPTRAVVQLWPQMLFDSNDEGDSVHDSEAFRWDELYRAAVRGDEGAVERLLQEVPRPALVNPSAPDEAGSDDGAAGGTATENSALHAAAYYGAVGCLGHFLDAWDNTACSLRNELSQTALHCAARGGQVEAIELLLAAGADVTAADADDQTPRDVAIREGHRAAARVLEMPELEKKATELGVVSDVVWERRLDTAQATIEQLEARIAENEATHAAQLATLEDEWRVRLEDQQIRRMEAMEQLRTEYEQRAAEQMHEAFASHANDSRLGGILNGSWGASDRQRVAELHQTEDGLVEHVEDDGLGTLLASGGRALRKSLSFRGSGGE